MSIVADMHVHSSFSIDARDDTDSMCESAIEKGLEYICFTDHCDTNERDPGAGRFQFDDYTRAIEAARERFGDRIRILKGIEFGEPHVYPKQFEEIVALDFDVVLGSMHWIGSLFVDESLLQRFTVEQAFEKYYEQVLATVRLGGFDVLAHLDFPKRYLRDSDESSGMIDEIMKELVDRGMALEINTSSIRKGLPETLPGPTLVDRYVRAGGRRITVGSDAHSCSDIATGFEHAERLVMANIGLQVGVFEGRKFRATT